MSSPSPYVVRVFPGKTFAYGIRDDGVTIGWGWGGNNRDIPATLPTPDKISVGTDHALALLDDGTVVAWGSNTLSQLDVPSGLNARDIVAGNHYSLAVSADAPYPLVAWGSGAASVPSLTNVFAVATGISHGAALLQDGTVTCWGDNTYGQTNVPSGLGNVTAITAGDNFSIATKYDYSISLWGDNTNHQLDVPSGLGPVAEASAGSSHVAVLTINLSTFLPEIVSWGRNTEGQTNTPSGFIPIQVVAFGNQTMAVDSNGKVHVWGENSPLTASRTPRGLNNVIQVSANYSHALALRSNGTVATLGSNDAGQITIPVGLANVIQVAAGLGHSAALKSDGTVVCWGLDALGQATVPSGLDHVTGIAAGSTHTVAVRDDGTVVSWGDGSFLRPPVGLAGVIQVAAGDTHEVALKSDGTVVCWGTDYVGEIDVPLGLTDVVQVATSYSHNVALKSDGTVVCWGSNTHGESTVPDGLTDVIQVAADFFHTFALKNDGTVVVWGTDGARDESATASSVTHVAAIFAGGNTSFCLPSVSLVVDSLPIVMGETGVGRVSMPIAPGVGGAEITLYSDKPEITVPSTVHIAENTHEATFPIIASGTVPTFGALSATLGDTSDYAIASTDFSPTALYGIDIPYFSVLGGSAPITATLYTRGIVPADLTVTLTSSDPHATVPATVVVPAGSDHVDFTITHSLVPSSVIVTITAANGADTVDNSFYLDPLTILGWDLPAPFYGGTSNYGTIYLNGPAPAGYSMTLTSDTASVTVPTTVNFVEGETTANFSMDSADISTDLFAKITFDDGSGSVPLPYIRQKVRPNDLVAITVSPRSFQGGSSTPAYGTVTLSGPAGHDTVITLSSDTPGAAWTDATVTVPASSRTATFPIYHSVVDTTTTVTITGTRLGRSKANQLTLVPPKILKFNVSSSAVIGGSTTALTGTIFLTKSNPNDVVVHLSSDDPSIVVPSTVTVLANDTSVTFAIEHTSVSTPTWVNLSATTGLPETFKTVTVNPNPVLTNDVSPPTATAGSGALLVGTVTLKSAVKVDTLVSLTSAVPNLATVPATVTILAGTNSATYTVTVTSRTSTIARSVGISATHGGVTKKRVISLTP